VSGTIRPGEFRVEYADTAEQAEWWRDTLARDEHYEIVMHPPEGSVDLPAIGVALAAARRALSEQMDIARAAALRAIDEERPEAAIARELGVDRMTVRKWAGK
jgi:hypothetical protein